jgi:hypothetical protein
MSQLGDAALGLPLDLLSQVLVIENRVTLPGTIGENNADEVRDGTLVWKVETSDAEGMYAESVTYNWTAIVGLIVAGAIFIAALVVIVVFLLLRRRPSSPAHQPEADSASGYSPQDPASSSAAGPTVAATSTPNASTSGPGEIALPPADAADPPAALPAAPETLGLVAPRGADSPGLAPRPAPRCGGAAPTPPGDWGRARYTKSPIPSRSSQPFLM